MTAPTCSPDQTKSNETSVGRARRRKEHRAEREKGTHGERSKSGNVPALSSSRLDDEHPVSAGRRTLLDRVARVDERVETRVGSEREFGDGHVVRDGRGEVDHGDVEVGVVYPGLLEDEERVERLEPSDEHQAVEPVLLELERDVAEVNVGQHSVGAELGPSSRRPAVDPEPVELRHVVLQETVKAVVDGDGRVASRETVPDSLSGGSVHSSGRSANATRKGDQPRISVNASTNRTQKSEE